MTKEQTRQSRLSLVGFAVALMVGAGFAVVMTTSVEPLAAGVEAPTFELSGPDGQTHALSDHRGKVVVLDFWSTTCPPCVRQLAVLEELHQATSREDVVILGINTEGASPDLVRRFAEQRGVGYDVLLDPGSVTALYRVDRLPALYLIGRDGRIRWSGIGLTPRRELERLVREAL
jgi:peroxiredoxin